MNTQFYIITSTVEMYGDEEDFQRYHEKCNKMSTDEVLKNEKIYTKVFNTIKKKTNYLLITESYPGDHGHIGLQWASKE